MKKLNKKKTLSDFSSFERDFNCDIPQKMKLDYYQANPILKSRVIIFINTAKHFLQSNSLLLFSSSAAD